MSQENFLICDKCKKKVNMINAEDFIQMTARVKVSIEQHAPAFQNKIFDICESCLKEIFPDETI